MLRLHLKFATYACTNDGTVEEWSGVAVIIFLILIAICGIFASLKDLWWANSVIRPMFSWRNLVYYTLLYSSIVVAFGIIYTGFEMQGVAVLHDTSHDYRASYWSLLEESMYFSAITMFGVGYGDVTPIGIGRWLAVVESLIGFTMPATFLMQTILKHSK
ncbi:MAG: ion channel [Bacilli bacterium]